MAAVITLSDSDDSDDLPPFAERVKQLINLETKKKKRNSSPKEKVSTIHSISDSENGDSRETIPLIRDRSLSPCSSFLETPIHNLNQNAHAGLNIDTLDRNRTPSPVSSLPDLNHNSESSPWSLPKTSTYNSNNNAHAGSNIDTLDINHRTPSPVFSLPSLNDNSESPPWSLPDLPDHFSNLKNICSDDNISIKSSKSHKEKRSNKDAEKEEKKRIRLEKKKEKELVKAVKASEKEILKQQKPEECIKNMKIVVDSNIIYLEGSQSIFNSLDEKNLRYSIERNGCKYSINWYRRLVNIVTENLEIVKEEREELEDTLVVIIPNEDFLNMVHTYVQNSKGRSCQNLTLEEFIAKLKSFYPDCGITCVTIGFQKFMRNIKNEGTFEMKTMAKQIHKNASEEAIIDLQLQLPVNFNFLDNMSEFGSLLQHFTKAIAEAPQRREKQNQKSLVFSWYADSDSHCPIKLSKDESSFIKLWRQQIQQFQNVGPEVADAIVSQYSSPRLLLQAYKRCPTTKDAENLLQDIVVRRNYGPLGTQKRIGPELSYKLHLFFTSRDGNKLLKR